MMTPELVDALVRWSARGATACYLLRLVLDLRMSSSNLERRQVIARGIWTVGCVLFLIHIGSAFAFVHNFDHSHAYAHTAERTAVVTGLHWGGGIYVNHAFLFFWIFDVARWWRLGGSSAYASKPYFWGVHSIFAFMFVNATIVFGPSHWIWIGLVVVPVLCVVRLSAPASR